MTGNRFAGWVVLACLACGTQADPATPRPATPEDTVLAFRTARQREFNRHDPLATAVTRSAVGLSAAADALAAAGEVGTATARELTFTRTRLARQLDEDAALRREVEAQRKALSYVTASNRALEQGLYETETELERSLSAQRTLVQENERAQRSFADERWDAFREIVLTDACPRRNPDCRDRALEEIREVKPFYDQCVAEREAPQVMDTRDHKNRADFALGQPATDFRKLSANKMLWCPRVRRDPPTP